MTRAIEDRTKEQDGGLLGRRERLGSRSEAQGGDPPYLPSISCGRRALARSKSAEEHNVFIHTVCGSLLCEELVDSYALITSRRSLGYAYNPTRKPVVHFARMRCIIDIRNPNVLCLTFLVSAGDESARPKSPSSARSTRRLPTTRTGTVPES